MAVSGPKESIQRQRAAEYQAQRAEKQARERISTATEAAREAEKNADQRIDYLRNQNDRLEIQEKAKHETQIENQRNNGYQELGRIRKQQARTRKQADRSGVEATTEIRKKYGAHADDLKREGTKRADELRRQAQKKIDFQKTKGDQQLKFEQEVFRDRLETNRSKHLEQMKHLHRSAKNRTEVLEKNFKGAILKNENKYKDKYLEISQKNNNTLLNLYKQANNKLNDLREDSLLKLTAYSSRNEDPFYKIMNLESKIFENDTEYMVRAHVPLHEQEGISINVQNDMLIIQGSRKNKEKHELAPGKSLQTATFQTFSETFPLKEAVDERGLMKVFDGETLEVRVPKKQNAYKTSREPYQAKTPKPIRTQRPRFPDNLPLAQSKADLELAKQDHLDFYNSDAEIQRIKEQEAKDQPDGPTPASPGSSPLGTKERT